SPDALAAQIFGLYVGSAYFTPVIGGWIADRFLGVRTAVTLGALLMTAGHFCMAFDRSFLAALALLVTGAGLMHGNVMSQVGRLYPPDDRRRADGFQIYYLGVNLSAFFAPLITGLLAREYGWHVGFGFAGIGMLVGLVIYLAGYGDLPPDPPRRRRAASAPLGRLERRRVFVLWGLVPVCALFWVAQSQVWNVYNFWVRDHVNLVVDGWRMPIPWLQAVDGLAPALLMPPLVALWRRQAVHGKEPDEPIKLAIGCLVFGAGMLWLAIATPLFTARVPVLWAIGFHLLSNLGWLYFTPISLALFARAAPARLNGMMVGAWSLATFLGSVISGHLGVLYSATHAGRFWLLHAAICAAGGAFFALCAPALRRSLLDEPAMPDATP
ncbi:MAG: peptide MFS transporter, partial [Gammaproteobacteria bacterium]|nr:peptide MFS transporter [Gammaproteobacteria bacterium]